MTPTRYRVDLVPPPDDPPTPEAVIREGLQATPWLLPEGDLYRYQSETTGVSFLVRPEAEGLRAEVPLAVPGFFAEEVFPRLEDLARALGLGFANPGGEPEPWSAGEAAAAYREANRVAAIEDWRSQRGNRPWLPEERLTAWWRHQGSLRELEEREELLTPPVELLLDKASGEVLLGSTWPDLAPRLLPRVDVLLVTWREAFRKRRRGGLRGLTRERTVAKEIGGYAKLADLEPFLAEHGTPVPGPIPLYRYEGAGDARHFAGGVPLLPKERFRILDPAQIVDARPGHPPPPAG